MTTITDPRYSRPLDVHRWSEHPEVKALVEHLWTGGYLPEEITGTPGKKRTGPKPKSSFKTMLRVLILDLYAAWNDDPDLSIGVSMSSNAWQAGSRYNALHLSKKMIPIIKALVASGLIDMAKGSYAYPGAPTNRTSRIRAAGPLQDMFRDAKFVREDVTRFEGEEILILRGEEKELVEYKDTPETIAMREELEAYNKVLAEAFIDFRTLEEPLIQLDKALPSSIVRIGPQWTRTRRIFSRGSWQMNGRFYGGWWQRLNAERRSHITINDQPTIEVDFQGLHVAMLYAEAGEELKGDPYNIPARHFPEIDPKLLRKFIKRMVLTAINAKDKLSAYKAFREGFPTGNPGKNIDNKTLEKFLVAVVGRNPVLEGKLFTDQGIRLMFLDSQITAHIHRHFTQQGVPVLSVHDSYIAEHTRVAELRDVMAEASMAVMGRALKTAIKIPGAEEFQPVSDYDLQCYVDNRLGKRTDGYMERVYDYQEETGLDITPLQRGDIEYYHDFYERDLDNDDREPDW